MLDAWCFSLINDETLSRAREIEIEAFNLQDEHTKKTDEVVDKLALSRGALRKYTIRRGEVDTAVIGIIYFRFYEASKEIYLDTLAIAKGNQGIGNGKAALDFVEMKARELGATYIWLKVDPHFREHLGAPARIIALYKSQGFRVLSEDDLFSDTGQPIYTIHFKNLVLMRKDLLKQE